MLANGVFIKVNKNMCSVLDVAPGGGGGVSVRVRNFHVPRLTVHLDLCSLRPSFRFQNPPRHHILHPLNPPFIHPSISLPFRHGRTSQSSSRLPRCQNSWAPLFCKCFTPDVLDFTLAAANVTPLSLSYQFNSS